MYKQGVILELREKEAIVFSDAGEYEKIERIEGMFVGQIVDYKKTRNKRINKFISAISVAAVLVAIFFSYSLFKNFKEEVFAYVTLDINPSMEFSINNKNCVLGLKPLNLEAEKITKRLSIKGKDIGLALSDVMDELERSGYIETKSENIIILSASSTELWNADDKRNIQISETVTSLKEIVRDCTKNHAYIEAISATPELRSLSIKSDMSLGRYALYIKALEEGKDISIQYAKTAPLSQLINRQDYISNSPDKTSIGNGNTDELSKSGTAGSDKNTGEQKKDSAIPQNTQTDVLVSNSEVFTTDTLPDDKEGIKIVLPDTTMPKSDEDSQPPKVSQALPTYNHESPSPTPYVNVSEHKREEPECSPYGNSDGKMRETMTPSPAIPPMFLPGKPDNDSEGKRPGHGFGMPGGNNGEGRPFADEDFFKRRGFEDGEGDEEAQHRETDNGFPDRGESEPESSPEFTPGYGRKTRQRLQGDDETP